MTEKIPTPELDKMLAVRDKSQIIGSFLDELREKDIVLCETKTGREVTTYDNDGDKMEEEFVPLQQNIEQLLADYFGIDLDECERERSALLESIRQ